MNCPACHGKGWEYGPSISHEFPDGTVIATADLRKKPCEECGGTGIIHCCDGLREQPEEDNDKPDVKVSK